VTSGHHGCPGRSPSIYRLHNTGSIGPVDQPSHRRQAPRGISRASRAHPTRQPSRPASEDPYSVRRRLARPRTCSRARPAPPYRPLRPYPSELIKAVPVALAAIKVTNDGPDLLRPLETTAAACTLSGRLRTTRRRCSSCRDGCCCHYSQHHNVCTPSVGFNRKAATGTGGSNNM
jgi:hypothetical protein